MTDELISENRRFSWKRTLRDCAIIIAFTVGLAGGMELIARTAVAPLEENAHERVEVFEVPPKVPGSFRIVTYGGSTAAGFPRPELGFPKQLESALRRSSPEKPVEVVNLGYAGKSSVYVRKMVERAGELSPDLLIVLSGHNEYLNRTDEDQSVTGKLARAAGRLALVRFATERLRAQDPEPLSPNYFLPEQVVPYDRTSSWYADRIAAHEANLKAVADWAKSHAVPVIFCTAPANLAEWPPIYRRIDRFVNNPTYYEDLSRVQALRAEGRNEDALAVIDRVMADYGEDAMFTYLRAYTCRDLGRTDEAYELYWRAIELDPFPQRVLPVMNEHIRALRDEGSGVYLADVAAAFEAESKDRLTGLRLVGDNVHPTLVGHALIAREIARVMAAQGLFLTAPTLPDLAASQENWLQAFMDENSSPSNKNWLYMKVAQFYSKYCQKYPFFYFELALQYQFEAVERAKEVEQDNWGFYGELGTLLIMNGRIDEGVEYLRHATALKGSPLDPNDHGSVNWIPEALEKAGITLDDLREK